jgi:hypothetical protein
VSSNRIAVGPRLLTHDDGRNRAAGAPVFSVPIAELAQKLFSSLVRFLKVFEMVGLGAGGARAMRPQVRSVPLSRHLNRRALPVVPRPRRQSIGAYNHRMSEERYGTS